MIELQDAVKSFRTARAATAALNGVSLTIEAGEVFGVIGPSGAGKSTLVRLINGLERCTSGRVLVAGQDVGGLHGPGLRSLRRRIGMIFQHFNLLSSKTAAANIAFPLQLAGAPRDDVRARVAQLLDLVGLADHAGKYPAQLSGGQKQRVGIARALATEPDVLLSDEATSALDPETTEQILRLLDEINRKLGLTIVLVTHEMDVVRRVCHRVAVLERGVLVESGEAADVFLHPQHPVTRRMVSEAAPERLLATGALPIRGERLRLTFRGAAADEPLLGRIARETGVDYRLISGRVDHIRNEPYAQLTIALTGGDPAAASRLLEAAGVTVEAQP